MAPYVPTPALVANRDPAGNQAASDITALASGGYVVTWVDTPAAGASSVRARVYDANGKPTSGEILVGTGYGGSATALPGGGFAVATIQGSSNSGTLGGAVVRLFDAAGAAQNAGVILGDGTGTPSRITVLSDGRLLVAGPGFGRKIVGSILSSDGAVLATSLQLSPTLPAPSSNSSGYAGYIGLDVSPLNDGGFAVITANQIYSTRALSGTYSYGSADVQIFDSNGQAKTPVFNLTDRFVTSISAATLPDGRVALGYESSQGANAGRFVFRLISSDGTLTDERLIGPAGTSGLISSFKGSGTIGLSATSDGNILVNYDRFLNSNTLVLVNSEVSEIFAPNGQKLDLVSARNPASIVYGFRAGGVFLDDPNTLDYQLAAALVNGSVALVEASSFPGQSDVLTRVYQPAAVTNDSDGAPLVNDAFYNARNPDVAAAGIDPDQHYDLYGWREGRSPNALFNSDAYRFANPDVAAANTNPLAHYDQSGWKEGRDPSAGFDNEVYLARNPDVKAAGVDPLLHYLAHGRAEGREASPAIGSIISLINGSFDAEYYLLSNPDVGRAVQSSRNVTEAAQAAYQHYQTSGWREGRNPNAYFDVTGYLNAYADVKAAGIDPLMHYDRYGWQEGRDPSGLFDTTNYRAANSDVREAGIDPLLHFLQFGAAEGRRALGDGTFE